MQRERRWKKTRLLTRREHQECRGHGDHRLAQQTVHAGLNTPTEEKKEKRERKFLIINITFIFDVYAFKNHIIYIFLKSLFFNCCLKYGLQTNPTH